MGEGQLVGLAEAARRTGRTREWLRQLVHAGKIEGAQVVGNSIGIPDSEVERLKQEPKRHGGWPKGKPRKPS